MANVYLVDHNVIPYLVEFAAVIVAFPIFALGIFTKTFLGIAQYPKLNFVLNIFLILIPLSLLVFISTDMFNKFRNIFSIVLIIYLIYLTIYTAIKKNRQSYFILLGWVIIASAGILMYLSSAGIFNIYLYYPYVVETSFVIEAIIFSIALADRIKQLQKEKEDVNLQLISQQNSEKQRLEEKVKEKTSDLKKALDEKGLLLKELNHRVKNNMQTIVSLIRLQADEIDDVKINEVFLTIQNRINAMGHLHEMLYKQDNTTYIDAREYFSILIDELKESYENNIGIFFDIKANLKMEEAIYCGLILNELVTNSFKYAFPDNEGTIYVSLEEEQGKFRFCIEDDGIGYAKETPSNSLGLILVDTLVKKQLKGEIFTNTKDGVKVMIVCK
jgi:two-component sensor histidine kinase